MSDRWRQIYFVTGTFVLIIGLGGLAYSLIFFQSIRTVFFEGIFPTTLGVFLIFESRSQNHQANNEKLD